MTNTNNSSLRQERAFAVEREFFRAARITPRYLNVIKWAVDKGLPSGKPVRPSDAKRASDHGPSPLRTWIQVMNY